MKIVVIGGTGLIGSKVVTCLRADGHEAVAASPDSGVNTLTGEGLAEVLAGRRGGRRRLELAVVRGRAGDGVLHDLHHQPARGRSGAGVRPPRRPVGRRHRPPERERLPPGQGRAGAADRGRPRSPTRSSTRRSSSSSSKSIADDGHRRRHGAAAAGADPADRRRRRRRRGVRGRQRAPADGIVEVAGPEEFRFDEFVRQAPDGARTIRARSSPTRRRATSAPSCSERTPRAGDGARLGEIRFEDWLAQAAVA